MWSILTVVILIIAAFILSINTGPTLGIIDFPPLRPLEPLSRTRSFSNEHRSGYSVDQKTMRNLISGVENQRIFVQKNGEWADTCLWANVFCNEDMEVTRISWCRLFSPVKFSGGSIDLTWIPSHVVHFDISHTQLEGTLETSALPRIMREMYLNYCNFQGTVDWENLPSTLEILNIGNNFFAGDVSLGDMSEALFQLNISKNSFTSVTGDLSADKMLQRNRIIGIDDIPVENS